MILLLLLGRERAVEGRAHQGQSGAALQEQVLKSQNRRRGDMACDCSGLFCGLFRLLDVEIRLAVEPFMLWKQDDIRPFLRSMPSMYALFASGYKPELSKVVLMALERIAGYLRDQPVRIGRVLHTSLSRVRHAHGGGFAGSEV